MPSNLQPILFLVAIAAVFYLLMIRPQQKKRKETQSMLQALRPGAEVVTTAGMFGKVVALEGDDALLIEVAPGVTCRYMRQSVMRVVPDVTATASTQESLPEASSDDKDDSSDQEPTADDAKAQTEDTADASVEETAADEAKPDDKDASDDSGAAKGDRRSSS